MQGSLAFPEQSNIHAEVPVEVPATVHATVLPQSYGFAYLLLLLS